MLLRRRVLLVGAATLGGARRAQAQSTFTLISHTHTTGGLTGGSSPPLNIIGANLLVFTVSYVTNGVNFVVISDSAGNTYTLAVDTTASPAQNGKQIFYSLNPMTGSAVVFTISTSGGANTLSVGEITAWSGAASSSVLGPTNHAVGTAATIQAGSVTPPSNGCLVIAGMTSQNTGAAAIDSGFTITDQEPLVLATNYSGAQAYLIQGAAGAVNPTWSGLTTTNGAAIAVFKPGAAPGTPHDFFFGVQ